MIETREALAVLDDILAVPGIDGVFVGPSDLSIALSNGAMSMPATGCRATRSTTCWPAATRSARRRACSRRRREGGRLRRRGYDLIALANDVMQLRLGVKTMLKQAKG